MKKAFFFKYLFVFTLIASAPELFGAAPALDTRKWFEAALTGAIATIEEYLNHGFLVDTRDVDYIGSTALQYAASNGHQDIVELLISRGADINIINDARMTPLSDAAINDHPDIVELLLSRGADHTQANAWVVLHTRQSSQAVRDAFKLIVGSMNK